MKAVRAHGGSDTGKLHDHTCCGKTWMADGRWLEGESLQRLIRKPLKTLEQQLLLGGEAEKKRKKASIYSKRAEVLLYSCSIVL